MATKVLKNTNYKNLNPTYYKSDPNFIEYRRKAVFITGMVNKENKPWNEFRNECYKGILNLKVYIRRFDFPVGASWAYVHLKNEHMAKKLLTLKKFKLADNDVVCYPYTNIKNKSKLYDDETSSNFSIATTGSSFQQGFDRCGSSYTGRNWYSNSTVNRNENLRPASPTGTIDSGLNIYNHCDQYFDGKNIYLDPEAEILHDIEQIVSDTSSTISDQTNNTRSKFNQTHLCSNDNSLDIPLDPSILASSEKFIKGVKVYSKMQSNSENYRGNVGENKFDSSFNIIKKQLTESVKNLSLPVYDNEFFQNMKREIIPKLNLRNFESILGPNEQITKIWTENAIVLYLAGFRIGFIDRHINAIFNDVVKRELIKRKTNF